MLRTSPLNLLWEMRPEHYVSGLAEIRASMNYCIDMASGPASGRSSILDMPDEILGQISQCLKIPDADGYASDAEDIANLRLVCRRFHDVSSRHLVDTIQVGIDSASLAHLETVARHPLIGRGVRAVEIDLGFYYAGPARSLEAFPQLASQLLSEGFFWISQEKLLTTGTEFSGLKGDDYYKKLQKESRRMIQAWREMFDDNATQSIAPQCRKLLQDAFDEYSKQHLDQQKLLDYGSFLANIGASFAKMPLARELLFSDELSYHTQKSSSLWTFEDHIFASLVEKRDWAYPFLGDLAHVPSDILGSVPIAIHEAGTWLRSIKMHLSDLLGPKFLEFVTHKSEDLITATSQLSNFFFFCKQLYAGSLSNGTMGGAETLFCTFLKSSELQHIEVCLENPECDSREWANIGPTIALQDWPKLVSAERSGIATSCDNLHKAIEQLGNRVRLFRLGDVYLLDGSWADVLDLMHRKSLDRKSLNGPRLRFRAQYPSEVGTDGWVYSEDHHLYEASDGLKYGPPPYVYINGKSDENVLRKDEADLGTGASGVIYPSDSEYNSGST